MPGYVVMVVDDELLARQDLSGMLRSDPECTLVLEAGSLEEAAMKMRNRPPDIVFLDVQLAKKTGFDLLRSVPQPHPVVVFATAFHEYALRAFDVEAADYILKPFDRPRVATALRRAKRVSESRRRKEGQSPETQFNFADFTFDSRDGLRTNAGRSVKLTPTGLKILGLLLRHAGHVLSKSELLAAVWPDVAVEEANLTQHIFMIRKALDNDNKEKYIQTEPGRGYRFVMPVAASDRELSAPQSPRQSPQDRAI